MPIRLSLFFFSFFIFSAAQAFDRLECNGSFKSWVVSRTESIDGAILSDRKRNVLLTEKKSERIYILDQKGALVATVFPWNSLYVRASKINEKKVKIIQKELSNGFNIDFKEIKSGEHRSLSCRFTF